MDTLSLLSTWLGAVGTILSAIVALVQLFAQMRQGHTSRTGFWIVTAMFVISAPLTAYGGYSLYKQYEQAVIRAARVSKIAMFAPDFAPAQLNELGENSFRSVYISEGDITVPQPLLWYAVHSPKQAPESEANMPQELYRTSAWQINYPKNRGCLYYQSTIDRNRWGWSAVALALIAPINLAPNLS
jgi:hypothetical protein